MIDSDSNPHAVFPNTGTFRSYVTNGLNQINSFGTQIDGVDYGSVKLTYDAAGNLTDDGVKSTFEWDAVNRLTAITYPGDKRSEFAYDGRSRRVQIVEKTGSTVTSTKRFVWIGNQIAEERDANNAVTRRYFDEGEERIGGTDASHYYYGRDHLGSIREVVDKVGEPRARYDFDPYGHRTKLGGTVDVDFGYTGHYFHAPSGLNLMLYRAYNASLGRWLSRDPIGERGGLNLYLYVDNDPIDAIDPLGLAKIYGNWCGPNWTGGQRETCTPNHPVGYYLPAMDGLDAACQFHDICYYKCRMKFHCNPRERQNCFLDCDTVLATRAYQSNGTGLFTPRGDLVATYMTHPYGGLPDAEANSSTCSCTNNLGK